MPAWAAHASQSTAAQLQTADTVALSNPKTSILIQSHHPYTENMNPETSGDSKHTFLHCGDALALFNPRNFTLFHEHHPYIGNLELQHDHVPLQKKEREEAPARPSAGSAFVPPSKRGGSFAPPAARARDEVSSPPLDCCCLLLL